MEAKYKGKKSPITGLPYSTKEIQTSIDLFKLSKEKQTDMLLSLGLSSTEIRKLKYEQDRVDEIMRLQTGGKKKKKKSTSSLRITLP